MSPKREVPPNVAAIAEELPRLAHHDWRKADRINLDDFPELSEQLGLAEGAEGVQELRDRLCDVRDAIAAEEEASPPRFQQSIALAMETLLGLGEGQDLGLGERRSWIAARWKTRASRGQKSFAGGDAFRNNSEKSVYEAVASHLLNLAPQSGATAQRLTTPQDLPDLPRPPWPTPDYEPGPSQEVVILIATPQMRHGTRSGLAKLVREFEPYWRETKTIIYSLDGSYRELWRAGLLHDYEHFAALPAGFDGGLVHATEIVVAAAEARPVRPCHVVYLIDPRDISSIYPATASIKRECLITQTPFLTSYTGAASWFRLEWARSVGERPGPSASRLLLGHPARGFSAGSGLEEPIGALALAAHDRHKRAMMEFADEHRELMGSGFGERWATRVTGHLLNGLSLYDGQYVDDILYDVSGQRRDALIAEIEAKSFAWQEQNRGQGPGSLGWIKQLTRGRQGGVVQLARKVLGGECRTVIFFQDAETPREHDMEIQVLDRAAQLPASDCLMLYDRGSASRWAENLSLARQPGGASAVTLVEAYRRVFGVELVLAYPPPARRRTDEGGEEKRNLWSEITLTAATYVVGLLKEISVERTKAGSAEPLRLGIPWGGTPREIIGAVPVVGDASPSPTPLKGGFASAVGINEFVQQNAAADLFVARSSAVRLGTWPSAPTEPWPAPFHAEQLRIISTVGVVGARDRALESHALATQAAQVLGGTPVHFPESAYAMRHHENASGSAPEADWDKLDVVLANAAPLKKRPVRTAKTAAITTALPTDLADFYDGAAGAVGTIYLEKNGEARESDSYRQVGISLERLRQRREAGAEVILVNGVDNGPARRKAALAALRANFASTFITDPDFAWAVLQTHSPSHKPATDGESGPRAG